MSEKMGSVGAGVLSRCLVVFLFGGSPPNKNAAKPSGNKGERVGKAYPIGYAALCQPSKTTQKN
jgi:hypothetical protein